MTTALDPQMATDGLREWVVGIARLPMYVADQGTPYRPSAIVWMDVETELIIGTELVPPQEAIGAAAANVGAAARQAGQRRSTAPRRIRVASQALAEELRRASLEGVEVVCAPTPELDPVFEELTGRVTRSDEPPDLHYLEGDVTPEVTAALFRAAADLYETRPWEIVSSDASLLGITSKPLGLHEAVISVIGQAGQVHGFVVFDHVGDFHRFTDASDPTQEGDSATYPCHLALTYSQRAEVGPALLAEIATHGWQVAGTSAYPVVTSLDEHGVGRGPTRSEVLRIAAIAAALAEIFREIPSEIEAATTGRSKLELSKRVKTSAGEVKIDVVVPAPGQSVPLDDELFDEGDELDESRVATYSEAILRRFQASPEAAAEPAARWSALVVNYAATYLGKTVMALSASELEEILFEIFPRKVSVEPEAAPEIVAGVRAFLGFLCREYPSAHAERRLRVLEGNASQRLARLLADPRRFGPAKAFMMGGRAAGFDMSSQAGLDAWAVHMRENGLRLPVGSRAATRPSQEPTTTRPDTRRAAKTKRKSQRAARKKSRSR
ncbi:MAG TPA: hypothetical protein VFT22_13045 [Kofleriaceae bacterium]|nr:hypothetical protein [Kofleriaceae bacterium]